MCSSSSCTGRADFWRDPEDFLFALLKGIFHYCQALTRMAFRGQSTTQIGRMSELNEAQSEKYSSTLWKHVRKSAEEWSAKEGRTKINWFATFLRQHLNQLIKQ